MKVAGRLSRLSHRLGSVPYIWAGLAAIVLTALLFAGKRTNLTVGSEHRKTGRCRRRRVRGLRCLPCQPSADGIRWSGGRGRVSNREREFNTDRSTTGNCQFPPRFSFLHCFECSSIFSHLLLSSPFQNPSSFIDSHFPFLIFLLQFPKSTRNGASFSGLTFPKRAELLANLNRSTRNERGH